MTYEIVVTDKAPKDPKSGSLVLGSITDQTKRIFTNISEVLEAADSSLEKVVKVSVFLKDMKDFGEMNDEYSKWFSKNPPARTTVQVAGLPLDVGIEIEVIALQ
jgi:2-iminobutanoate/2-iminopropanoate deaminase